MSGSVEAPDGYNSADVTVRVGESSSSIYACAALVTDLGDMFNCDEADIASQWWNGKNEQDSATSITLAAGQCKAGADAAIVRGCSIQGKVTVPRGEDSRSVPVLANDQAGDTISTEVSPTGEYSINLLAAGTYKVELVATNGDKSNMLSQWARRKSDEATATSIKLEAGDKLRVNVEMKKAASIAETELAPGDKVYPHRAQCWNGKGESTSANQFTVTAGGAQNYVNATLCSHCLKKGAVTVVGVPQVGFKLNATPGTWAEGVTVTYQWYASGKKIVGATKPTYILKKAQAGKTITVKTTGSLAVSAKVTITSAKINTVTG